MADYNKEAHRKYHERSKVIGIRLHKEKDRDILDTLDILETLPGIKSRQAWLKELMRQYFQDHQEQIQQIDLSSLPEGVFKEKVKVGNQIFDFYVDTEKEEGENVTVPGLVRMVVCTSGLTKYKIYDRVIDGDEMSISLHNDASSARLEAYATRLYALYKDKTNMK